MDPFLARTMVESLSKGINPLSGRALPLKDSCSNEEIQEALLEVLAHCSIESNEQYLVRLKEEKAATRRLKRNEYAKRYPRVLNRPEADQLLPPVWRRIFEACHPGIHAVAQLLVDSDGVIILRFPVAHKIRSEFLAAFSIEDTVTIESFLLRFGNEISPAMFTAGNALLILLEIQRQFQQAESV